MKRRSTELEGRRKRQGEYLTMFAKYHMEWMKEVVSAYKARGVFPLFPTFIANYYEDDRDKEVAVISTLCLNWHKDVLPQVKALRSLMGEHPYEWLTSRAFVLISTGRRQDKRLMEQAGQKYWKIARFISMLYDLCDGRSLKRTFARKGSLVRFASEVGEAVSWKDCEYKAEVVELVLRASDGFSIGLWATERAEPRCPVNKAVNKFLRIWFPDFDKKVWDSQDAVNLFGLERSYDFFYFYLAWEELRKSNTEECVLYATRYIRRYTNGIILPPSSWIGSHQRMPEIRFKD